MDSRSPLGLRTLLTVWLPLALAHELHHSTRVLDGPGYGTTLLDTMVSEGGAEAFVREMYPYAPPIPWVRSLVAVDGAPHLARSETRPRRAGRRRGLRAMVPRQRRPPAVDGLPPRLRDRAPVPATATGTSSRRRRAARHGECSKAARTTRGEAKAWPTRYRLGESGLRTGRRRRNFLHGRLQIHVRAARTTLRTLPALDGRTARRLANRDRILDAALDLVAEGAELDVDTIAERANVSVRSVYNHFPTARHLVAGMYERGTDAHAPLHRRPARRRRCRSTSASRGGSGCGPACRTSSRRSGGRRSSPRTSTRICSPSSRACAARTRAEIKRVFPEIRGRRRRPRRPR